MSYLLDKKRKRIKILKSVFYVAFFLLLIIFNQHVFHFLSSVVHFVAKPILGAGNTIGDGVNNAGYVFQSKKTLVNRNESLQTELDNLKAKYSDYSEVVNQNTELKSQLNRVVSKDNFVLANILAKPNQSAYDTLILDVGEKYGIQSGDMLFAGDFIPIGEVVEVFPNSSKAMLYSASGKETEVSLHNVYFSMIGRGGNNFEIDLPRDFEIMPEDAVFLPGEETDPVAIFEKIISDPRDSFARALFVSPLNIQNIKFVQVKRNGI